MIRIMSGLQNLVCKLERGRRVLASGDMLFHMGDSVTHLHVVLSGEVVLERNSRSGVRLVLQHARSGEVIAEPSIFAARYHCGAIATTTSTVAFAPVEAIRSTIMEDAAALEALARRFARDVQAARFRAEILSLRRISDRLDAWLDLSGGVLPEKGGWISLAADLAVTPEALYRELAKRRGKPAR